MDLTLVLGPMKSGKSFDLISYFAPLKYTNIPHALYQSARNVRDEHIYSRNGVVIEAKKVETLDEAACEKNQVIGIDEVHMFAVDEVKKIERLLKKGVKVVVAGLDMDYRGRMFDVVRGLFELGPKEVRCKRAVCEVCKNPDAIYTQVLKLGEPIFEGMPSVIPDDGTFTYQSVCRHCFKKP